MKKKDDNISHIISLNEATPGKGNLYLGAVRFLNERVQLKKKKQIGCVLTILGDRVYTSFKVKQKIEEAQVPIHKWIDLEDNMNAWIFPQLKDACEFIRSNLQKTNVFVHCHVGVSRSATIVIAFMMMLKGWDREEAFKLVKQKRKWVEPNERFWNDLKNWEQYIKNDIKMI